MDGESDSEYRLTDDGYAASVARFASTISEPLTKRTVEWTKCHSADNQNLDYEIGLLLSRMC